jgi:hypothetical protein
MNDLIKYKKKYYIFATPIIYFIIYFILEPEYNSVIFEGYSISTFGFGIFLLILSQIFKKFRLSGLILLNAIIGCAIIYIYSGKIFLSGYFLYSASFTVFSADAVYSISNKLQKLLIFIVPLLIYILFIIGVDSYLSSNYIISRKLDYNITPKTGSSKQESNNGNENTDKTNKDVSDPQKSKKIVDNPVNIDSINNAKRKTDTKNEITSMIYSWKYAWESKNIGSVRYYLTKDYKYVGKDNKEIGINERMKRMEKTFKDYKYIKIELRDITFTIEDEYPDDITAEFYMTYKSNAYSDEGLKTLKIYRGKSTAGKWKIYKEYFEYAPPPPVQNNYIPQSTKPDFWDIIKSILKWGGIILLIILVIALIKKIFN